MQSFEVTYKQYCTHAINELDNIYSMHKNKQQQKRTKNKNEQNIYILQNLLNTTFKGTFGDNTLKIAW